MRGEGFCVVNGVGCSVSESSKSDRRLKFDMVRKNLLVQSFGLYFRCASTHLGLIMLCQNAKYIKV